MKHTTIQSFTRLSAIGCLLAGTVMAQSAGGAENMEFKGLTELNIFAGLSKVKGLSQGLGTSFSTSPVGGVRFTGNYWKYVGVELGYGVAGNKITFETLPPGQTFDTWGGTLHQFNLNPIFHFTPRGAKLRPFLTVGLSALDFRPKGPAGAKSDMTAAMNYGGGVKYHLNDRTGLRFDMRGLYTKGPTFGLPTTNTGGFYIPSGLRMNAMQLTGGVDIYFGKKTAPPPPPPPPPPPAKPEPLPALIPGVIHGYEGDHYPGQPLSLRLDGASDPAGKTVAYRWKVNGQNVGTGLNYNFTPNAAGPLTAEVEEEAPNNEGYPARMAKAGPVTFSILDYGNPTISMTPRPDTVNVGDPVSISLSTTPGAGATSVTTRVTASEGGLSGSGNAWTLDTSSVRFDQNGKPQSKNVTLNATATNNAGKSAGTSGAVKVNYTPKAIRFSDVIFSKGMARVNNCGKRILIDELAPKAADPDYDVVLVGHIDGDEAPKGKLPASVKPLSYRRAMQAAAVLTAGKGTCASVDPSRVKIVDAGTQQLSDMQPGLCGTSARPAAKERSLRQPTEKDQNRRVEVWLVPRAGQQPPAASGAAPVESKELKRLACPN